jgi:hypothetical protein
MYRKVFTENLLLFSSTIQHELFNSQTLFQAHLAPLLPLQTSMFYVRINIREIISSTGIINHCLSFNHNRLVVINVSNEKEKEDGKVKIAHFLRHFLSNIFAYKK